MTIYDDNRTVNNKDTDDMISPIPGSLELTMDEIRGKALLGHKAVADFATQKATNYYQKQLNTLKAENEGLRKELGRSGNVAYLKKIGLMRKED